MTIEELNARLREMRKSIVGPWPRVTVVQNGGDFYVSATAHGSTSRNIFQGHGPDLVALLDQAQEAIDGASPIMLARTLGIEPIPVESAAE